MARMLQSGKRTISVGAMQPKDLQRSGDFDPVIGYAEDPERVSDKKLRALLCEDGSIHACTRCVCIDHCQYGRELVRRAKCRQGQKPSEKASIPQP